VSSRHGDGTGVPSKSAQALAQLLESRLWMGWASVSSLHARRFEGLGEDFSAGGAAAEILGVVGHCALPSYLAR
jgi:hypothetical protein